MPNFVKGDILLFKYDASSFHNLVYEDSGIDKCMVVYSDDINYYFESSRLSGLAHNQSEEEDSILLSIPIFEIDNKKREYTIGLKTILKKL